MRTVIGPRGEPSGGTAGFVQPVRPTSGGKPNPGTKKDRRLKENRTKTSKSSKSGAIKRR